MDRKDVNVFPLDESMFAIILKYRELQLCSIKRGADIERNVKEYKKRIHGFKVCLDSDIFIPRLQRSIDKFIYLTSFDIINDDIDIIFNPEIKIKDIYVGLDARDATNLNKLMEGECLDG